VSLPSSLTIKSHIHIYSAQEIDHYSSQPSEMGSSSLPAYANPEYNLIVTANNLSVELENEIMVVHKVRGNLLEKVRSY